MSAAYYKGSDGLLHRAKNVHVDRGGGIPESVIDAKDQEILAEAKAYADKGLTGAKIGDLMQITAVDSKGVPTALKPTTMEELEGKWELIETINVEASGAISRSQEPNGKPYDFKALGFKVKLVPRDPGVYIVVYVNTQPDIVGEYTLFPLEKSESYYVIETIPDRGAYANRLCGPTNRDTKNPAVNSISYKHAFTHPSANHIINFESLVDPFLPGDIFEIWAVRA